ncbi:MAG: hypothetical protein A3H33_13675 [Betaproteobacteria bacterium RIFCSPLOWO2_02_FULL_65_20]|nr:MAG: hypothetical protein A3H33_13675 [Betaproteobacteria bacterium RIFCSPLOWO2_02_FULL_65_20]
MISILKCVVLAAFAGALAASAAAQSNVMKLSTATINDVQHEWMKRFAADVEKNSKGRIKPEIYPASQLGAIPRQIEGTQFGSIQAWIGPPEFLAGVDSRYELLSAPGLFKDSAHASRTMQDPEFKAAFLALGADKGLKGVSVFLYGPLMVVARTPIRKLADFEGLKIRVLAGAMQMNQMRRLKGTPVPMSLGEVLPAVQQGALDGSMSALPVFTAFRYWDAAKYIYESNHGMVTSITVVSKIWFDKLPPDLQKVVTDAAEKATKDNAQWTIEFLGIQRDRWLKAGGEIIVPTQADHAQLMKLMLPIGAEVTAKKPQEKAMYELLLKAAKRTE